MLLVFTTAGLGAFGVSSPPIRAEPAAVTKGEPQESKPFAVAGKVSALAWGRDGLATISGNGRKCGRRRLECNNEG